MNNSAATVANGSESSQGSTLAYMHAARRWMLWRAEPDPKPDDPHHTRKVPYYFNGGKRGKTDCPDDWAQLTSYQDALSVVGKFTGLAFALGPDESGGHWQGIDWDDLQRDHVEAWVASVPGSYVEISPSGRGLHAIGYGEHFEALGSNGSGLEAYAHGRYFTFTAHTLKDEPLCCLAQYVREQVAPRHQTHAQRAPGVFATGSVYVDPQTVAHLRSALMHLRADDYHMWVRMGCALAELGDVGRGLWIEWSRTSDKWKPEDAKKWDSFRSDRTGYAAVFAEAQRHGWVHPASNAAQIPLLASASLELVTFDWDNEPEFPADLVAGLVADEEVTLLGGHGGIGKGFLALQLAVAVAIGDRVLGHSAAEPKRVIYYSAEDGRKRISARLRRLLENYTDEERTLAKQNLCVVDASELDPLLSRVAGGLLNTQAAYSALQRLVASFDAQLVVVDGASDTFDGNEIVKREVTAFVRVLKRLHPARRIGVLLIVHIDRASARGHTSNDEGYSGNVAWHNACRRRMYLHKRVDRDEETKEEIGETITLRVMKNQDAPPAPDMEVIRQPSGFWHPAVTFTGGMTERGGNYSSTVLRLIDEYYQRGKWISTSLAGNSSAGVHATLKGDPNFPPITSKQTAAIVRQLEREQKLAPEGYRRTNGGKGERWKAT